MTGHPYFAAGVLIMAVVTVLLRAAPFAVLRRFADSELTQFLGATMPVGVMVVLVAYSLTGVDFLEPPYGAPSVIGVLATVAVHHSRRNALFSIVVGTGAYMVLERMFT